LAIVDVTRVAAAELVARALREFLKKGGRQ